MRMFKRIEPAVIVIVLGLYSCVHEPLVPKDPNPEPGPDVVVECDANVVYFQNEILPLLISNCAKSGCHDAITAEEEIELTSYTTIMQSGLVKKSNPKDSKLMEVITETDPGDVMPPPPHERLTSAQISKIRTWISQGAQNNSCESTACDTTNVTFSASILPLMTNKCTGCHGGTTPSGNINLTNHTGVQTVALNGRLMGSLTHAAGFVPMPQGGNKLSACEIDMIRIWIDASAPNN